GEAEVNEPCVTKQGITLSVRAVIAFKVGDDNESITNAARRFLNDQASMPRLTGRIFAGHLRSIVGSMTVESLIRERQELADTILDASKPEMAKLGLVVDALQIESIDDHSGYIEALSQPHVAKVNQDAAVAKAAADQAAAKAAQESARNQSEYQRDTAVAQARFARDAQIAEADAQAEVDRAKQTAAQAGPLATAEAQQGVLAEKSKLAQAEAEYQRQQLVADVVRPAEAEAEKTRVLAAAQAEATRVLAAATASSDGIALQRMLVERMPELLTAVASELRHANVTVLNGAEGMGELVAGLVSQATALLSTVRASTPPPSPIGGNENGKASGSEVTPAVENVSH
ncbi:MAG: SPFH domain-containing protein, partial [Acidimicrobiales bacterium]